MPEEFHHRLTLGFEHQQQARIADLEAEVERLREENCQLRDRLDFQTEYRNEVERLRETLRQIPQTVQEWEDLRKYAKEGIESEQELQTEVERLRAAIRNHECVVRFIAGDGMPAFTNNDGADLRQALSQQTEEVR